MEGMNRRQLIVHERRFNQIIGVRRPVDIFLEGVHRGLEFLVKGRVITVMAVIRVDHHPTDPVMSRTGVFVVNDSAVKIFQKIVVKFSRLLGRRFRDLINTIPMSRAAEIRGIEILKRQVVPLIKRLASVSFQAIIVKIFAQVVGS